MKEFYKTDFIFLEKMFFKYGKQGETPMIKNPICKIFLRLRCKVFGHKKHTYYMWFNGHSNNNAIDNKTYWIIHHCSRCDQNLNNAT